jgi:hypothetical protein
MILLNQTHMCQETIMRFPINNHTGRTTHIDAERSLSNETFRADNRTGRTTHANQQPNTNLAGGAAQGRLSRATARIGQAFVQPNDGALIHNHPRNAQLGNALLQDTVFNMPQILQSSSSATNRMATYPQLLGEWASQPHGSDENRSEAANRLVAATQNFQNHGILEFKVDLAGLGLRSLPPMPEGLNNLNLNNNQLTSLPENLPASLTKLYVKNNQLTQLPDNLPANLAKLDVSNNQLQHLPENLPANLTMLDCSSNQLTQLPANLPAKLTQFSINNNQLTQLPENLPVNLKHLWVGDNQLNSLPENLPANLQTLYVKRNQLTDWPKNLPETLRKISVHDNPEALSFKEPNGSFTPYKIIGEDLILERDGNGARFLELSGYFSALQLPDDSALFHDLIARSDY